MTTRAATALIPSLVLVYSVTVADDGKPLPGTEPLEIQGDIASDLVAGVDRFLSRKLEESVGSRERLWKRNLSSTEAYRASVAANRERLAHFIGARDRRVARGRVELVGPPGPGSLLAVVGDERTGFEAHSIRWSAFGDVTGEGLLLLPRGRDSTADVVAIPDADQTPEMIAGLVRGVAAESQYARRLAESGCRVIVPTLIDRDVTYRKLSNREFLYRSAFELGRHLIGYEVEKVLAAVDWFDRERGGDARSIGVIGWGEGALVAFYSAAVDERITATCVSGYFTSRQDVWREPIYRNVFALLHEFGDAEIASLIAPRALVVEACRGVDLVVPTGTGGGPGRLVTPALDVVRAELDRARRMTAGLSPTQRIELVVSGEDGRGPYGSAGALEQFLAALSRRAKLATRAVGNVEVRRAIDAGARHARQMHELDRHNQWLLRESEYVRKDFLAKLDRSSLEKYEATIEPYREIFREEIIGRFPDKRLPANPRSRRVFDEERFTGYELVLDVFPDVIAYGILLVPQGIADGERRPVVVCQHGLEGRPRDVADPSINHHAYWQYAVQLAKRGYVTFAPQNLYIFGDRFRTLQRKANSLKRTLFSIIVPQHEQITDWLAGVPFVDPERIAFYGLSYGGKSAMRIPPLVPRYCLSICSADFNEWVSKNASTRHKYSYVWTGEYEIFEFDLGSTFNYMEMAALICPRPFMVERGHFDGVASDEMVAYEFAKVRFLYAAQLKIPERCEIEWFDGPHTINGKGTFAFLDRHLGWTPR